MGQKKDRARTRHRQQEDVVILPGQLVYHNQATKQNPEAAKVQGMELFPARNLTMISVR